MINQEFEQLKVGNVLKNQDGAEFVVMHVVRDANGNATYAAIFPALSKRTATFEASGVHWEIVSKTHTELYVDGTAIKSKAIQEKEH